MARVSAGALAALADTLPERDRHVVLSVSRLRLVAGSQLERLHFHEIESAESRARIARRVLQRLTTQRLLFRLERRIGGVRAGSAGYVYGLGSVGKRLTSYWRGEGLGRVRSPHEPQALFVRHTLAVAEQFVLVQEAARRGAVELLAFDGEPDCWRPFTGRRGQRLTLKPDAFVRLGVGPYESCSFLEVDRGTQGRGALVRKCQLYVAHWRSGIEQAERGVYPRVVWATTNQVRVRVLQEACAAIPAEAPGLFAVTTLERSLPVLSGES